MMLFGFQNEPLLMLLLLRLKIAQKKPRFTTAVKKIVNKRRK